MKQYKLKSFYKLKGNSQNVNIDRRNFLGCGCLTVIGAAALSGLGYLPWKAYTAFFRPDRDLSEAEYHVFVESKGTTGQRNLYFNVVNFATGDPVSTGYYQDRGQTEQEQLRFGDDGRVFFKLTETNLREGFNRKKGTKVISAGTENQNRWQVVVHDQYHFGGPKVSEIYRVFGEGKDTMSSDTPVCRIEEIRGKFWGFTAGVNVALGDGRVLLRSYDSDLLNGIGMEASETVKVYGGQHKYSIEINHELIGPRQHGINSLWTLEEVVLRDEKGVCAASLTVDESFFKNQPTYVFRIGDDIVGRIVKNEKMLKQYKTHTSRDEEGNKQTIRTEDISQRQVSEGLYFLQGTDPVKCSMVMALMAEKMQWLGFDYKTNWMDFGIDTLKLSQNPDDPEYALHLPLDMNLTPRFIARSLETVFGYKPPKEFADVYEPAKELAEAVR